MGIVYEARQLRPGRTIALKVIRPDRARPGSAARFLAEAETAARLQHPSIVQLFEVIDYADTVYLCMEYVSGGNLAERLTEAPLPARLAAGLVENLAGAIAVAHAQGILHQDLKPANILLQKYGLDKSLPQTTSDGNHSAIIYQATLRPKIADFGLAKRLDGGDDATLSGAVLGTPSCLAPELTTGQAKNATHSADQYALGAFSTNV